jgi:hypothetical protein
MIKGSRCSGVPTGALRGAASAPKKVGTAWTGPDPSG